MRILFIGTGEIGVPTLEALLQDNAHEVVGCVTQPDKPVGRRQQLQASGIKQLALGRGIPVFQPVKIREPAAVETLRALAPDIAVVIAYGQILPRDLLGIPKVACLNLHASILPKHRGAAPIHAAIESGDAETGMTVMYMDEGLDTGDILLIKSLRIGRRETTGQLHERLAHLAPLALAEALPLLAAGSAPRIPQDPAAATYAAKLSRDNGQITWGALPCAIDGKIRAMNPWPAAHTFLPTVDGPRKLKVFGCIQHRHCSGEPGQVLAADKRGILVASGRGGVLLREIQLEGKKRMHARDFLLGHPVPVGTVLG